MRSICILALALGSPAAAQDLLAELAETGRFDRFVAGVEAAELGPELEGAVTILVPTDQAVEASPDLAAAFEGNPDLIRRVLLTHIASGAAHASDALPQTLSVASGETVTIRFEAGQLTARVDGGAIPENVATIGGGEIRAGGGVAHPLSGLLLPQDATLEALARAPETVVAEAEEGPPIPEDGIFLDDVVREPDPEAVEDAPVVVPDEEPEVITLQTEEVIEPSEPQVVTTAPEPEATEGDEVQAPRVAEGVAAGVEAAGAAGDGTVIIEDLDVTVEAAPRVQPRTVAPSEMTGEPVPAGGSSGGETQQTAAAEGEDAAPAQQADEGGDEGPQEEILTANIVGWAVFGPEGEEVGSVEELVMVKETGAIEAVLVEVGSILGTGLGGKLVRLEREEWRMDAADEALIASVSGEEITGRPDYEGPELDP